MIEPCATCCRVNLPGTPQCACSASSTTTTSALALEPTLSSPIAHQLARAWLSIGVGGLTLFLAYTLALGHVGATMWCASLGGLMMVRGGRVVSRTGAHLLEAANQADLPSARIVR